MMILLLLESGCRNTSANNFCFWADPITISQEEFDKMSEETLRQIDNFNQEWEEKCDSKMFNPFVQEHLI